MTLVINTTGPGNYGDKLKMLVAGYPGSKMSLFASTWENPLFLTTESLMLLADKEVPYAAIRTVEDLENIRQVLADPDLKKDLEVPVDSVILYTLDEMQRMMVRERKAYLRKENLAAGDQMQLNDEFRAFLSGFRNLDLNVLFITHIKMVGDEETGRTIKPGLSGALADEVVEYVDEAVVMRSLHSLQVEDDAVRRVQTPYLQCAPDSQFPWIRDDSNKLPAEIKIGFVDDFSKIHSYVYGEEHLDKVIERSLKEQHQKAKVFGQERQQSAKKLEEQLRSEPEPTKVPKKRGRPRKNPLPEPIEPEAAVEQGPSDPVPEAVSTNPVEILEDQDFQDMAVLQDKALRDLLATEEIKEEEPEEEEIVQDVGTDSGSGGIVIEKCSSCFADTDPDQVALSKLRFRKILCRPCFISEKTAEKERG